MDIYNPDGVLDVEKATSELRATAAMPPSAQRDRIAILSTAALIDIAASLSIVALEAGQAMNLGGIVDALNNDEPDDEGPRDFLVVGDLVHLIADTEPGEVVKLGFDQGDTYADVVFADGRAERYYVRNLERIIGDEAPAEVVDDAFALATSHIDGEVADAVEAADPDLTDALDEMPHDLEAVDAGGAEADVDDDFDETPLAALEAKASGKRKGKR